jgi:hypothetical protein
MSGGKTVVTFTKALRTTRSTSGAKTGITDAGYRGPLLFLAFTVHRRSVIRDGISF